MSDKERPNEELKEHVAQEVLQDVLKDVLQSSPSIDDIGDRGEGIAAVLQRFAEEQRKVWDSFSERVAESQGRSAELEHQENKEKEQECDEENRAAAHELCDSVREHEEIFDEIHVALNALKDIEGNPEHLMEAVLIVQAMRVEMKASLRMVQQLIKATEGDSRTGNDNVTTAQQQVPGADAYFSKPPSEGS